MTTSYRTTAGARWSSRPVAPPFLASWGDRDGGDDTLALPSLDTPPLIPTQHPLLEPDPPDRASAPPSVRSNVILQADPVRRRSRGSIIRCKRRRPDLPPDPDGWVRVQRAPRRVFDSGSFRTGSAGSVEVGRTGEERRAPGGVRLSVEKPGRRPLARQRDRPRHDGDAGAGRQLAGDVGRGPRAWPRDDGATAPSARPRWLPRPLVPARPIRYLRFESDA
jgi:hypothetical protein